MMFTRKSLLAIRVAAASLALGGLITACQQTADMPQHVADSSNADATVHTSAPVAVLGTTQSRDITVPKFSDFAYVDGDTLLISSETQGIFNASKHEEGKKGEPQKILAGQFETLKAIGSNHIAALDAKANALTIFHWNGDALTPVTRIQDLGFKLDGFCFYDSAQDGSFYSFLLDGDGHVEQHLLAQTSNGNREFLMKPALVKRFFVGPENNNCLANAHTGKLYFNETTAGLWQYPASAEASLERELVRAIEPHGTLPEEFTEMVWVDEQNNVLAGLSEETGNVVVIPLNESSQVNVISLSDKNAELTRLKTHDNQLVTLDAASEQLLTLDHSVSKATVAPTSSVASVFASVQTDAVDAYGDAADDPAIWHNSQAPEASRILGTNKKLGLMVYDMQGNEQQRIENGHVNNVDLRYGYSLNGKIVDVAAASNRSNNAISIYSIDPASGHVAHAFDVPTALEDIYGLCMQHVGDEYSVWANDKDGTFVQYILKDDNAQLGRSFKLPSQPEGCVVDDAQKVLFAGEEDAGVWRLDMAKNDSQPQMIIPISEQLVADVEGLAIAHARNADEQDLLVISSQGDHSYVLAEMTPPYKLVGKFRVVLNPQSGIDGTAETDGIEVSTKNFGPGFEGGLMVIQDGYNLMPVQPQNFKYVSWDAVIEATDTRAEK